MRTACIAIGLAGCGSVSDVIDAAAIDAAPDTVDAPVDTSPDAPCMATLFTGGVDTIGQGWSRVVLQPARETLGSDFTELATTTNVGASTGGQILLYGPTGVAAGAPVRVRVEFALESVGRHNPADAGAGILGAFTPPFGLPAERAQMIYLDGDTIGWADDSGRFAAPLVDGAYHTLELAVAASGAATVTLDGAPALTRAAYTTGGTIAIGDQTNDPNVDSTMRLRAVSRLCP